MKQQEKSSLLDMVQGGVKERVGLEFEKIMDNILDPNTEAKKKRTITLKIEFAPDAERKTIGVSYTASSKLIPMNPISTSLYVGTDPQTGEIGAVELTPQIPGQKNMMDDSEQLEGKVIPITRKAALAR